MTDKDTLLKNVVQLKLTPRFSIYFSRDKHITTVILITVTLTTSKIRNKKYIYLCNYYKIKETTNNI